MARQRFSAEQIIHKLGGAEVELAKGTAVRQVCRQLNITDKTDYRWRTFLRGLKERGCLSRARRGGTVT